MLLLWVAVCVVVIVGVVVAVVVAVVVNDNVLQGVINVFCHGEISGMRQELQQFVLCSRRRRR